MTSCWNDVMTSYWSDDEVKHDVVWTRCHGVTFERPRRHGQSVDASLSNQSACDTLNYDEVVCGAESQTQCLDLSLSSSPDRSAGGGVSGKFEYLLWSIVFEIQFRTSISVESNHNVLLPFKRWVLPFFSNQQSFHVLYLCYMSYYNMSNICTTSLTSVLHL